MAAKTVGGHEAFIMAFICALLPGIEEGTRIELECDMEASLPRE